MSGREMSDPSGSGERAESAPTPEDEEAGGGDASPASVASRAAPRRLEAREEDVDSGVAQLVLTLVELVRQVLEKEAVRRMEAGTLTDEEVERLGRTLMRLRERMDELKDIFDLEDEDLELDLGPLSRLL